jgi:4-hydroxy-3-polyprenylbenzoate decarboxylase
VRDHATSEWPRQQNSALMKKLPGEGFKRPWPPLIKMDEAVKAKVENCLM